MAIYHLSVKTGSRGGGQSAKAKSDYIEREGKYEKDRDELAYSESGNMPEWAEDDPQKYWEAADAHERANGSLFKEVEFALPVELDDGQQRELASSFAAELTGGERLPYTMAIHRGGGDNPHVHLMISERGLDGHARDAEQWFKRANKANPEKGGALKTRSLNKEWLANTRQAWETAANGALERAGRSERIDHRSLAAQRAESVERGQVDRADELSRPPGVHLGPERYRAQRGGTSRVVELSERIEQSNRADRAEREQEGSRFGADGRAGADIAAEIAGIEARLKEIYDRTRAAIDSRLEQVGRAIRAGADAVGRAGKEIVRAGSGLAEQYRRERTQLAVQVERLKEDIKTFAQQYANDQKREKDRYQGLPLQLNRFEKELQLFVQQVKKETAQRERLTERIEALGDLSLHVDGLTSQFASFRENLNLLLR